MLKQAINVFQEHSARLAVNSWASQFLKEGRLNDAIALMSGKASIEETIDGATIGVCLPCKADAIALLSDPFSISRMLAQSGIGKAKIAWKGSQGNHYTVPAELQPDFDPSDDPLIDSNSRDSLLALIAQMHESEVPQSLGCMETDAALFANPVLLRKLGESLSQFRAQNLKLFWKTRDGQPDPTLHHIKSELRQKSELRISYENLWTVTQRARLDTHFLLRLGGSMRHCIILSVDKVGAAV